MLAEVRHRPMKGQGTIWTLSIVMAAGYLSVVAQPKVMKKEVETEFVVGRNGKLMSDQTQVVKSFDKNGRLLEESEQRYWSDVKRVIVHKKQYFYGPADRVDSIVTADDGKNVMVMVSLFDAAGRQNGVQEYTADGKFSFTTKYQFNMSNQKIREEMYAPDGSPFNFKTYVYDKAGNMVEQSASEKGTPRYRWVYAYNTKSHLIQRDDYSGEGVLLHKRRYAYNAESRIVRETVLAPSGVVERVIKYTYEYY